MKKILTSMLIILGMVTLSFGQTQKSTIPTYIKDVVTFKKWGMGIGFNSYSEEIENFTDRTHIQNIKVNIGLAHVQASTYSIHLGLNLPITENITITPLYGEYRGKTSSKDKIKDVGYNISLDVLSYLNEDSKDVLRIDFTRTNHQPYSIGLSFNFNIF